MPAAKSGKQYQTILDHTEDIAVQSIALRLVAQNRLHDKFGRPVKVVRGRVPHYSLTRFALLELTSGRETPENHPSYQTTEAARTAERQETKPTEGGAE